MSSPRKGAAGQKYHRIEVVADRLDLSPRSVRRLIDNGHLEAIKIGGAVRVSEDGLLRLLAASRIVTDVDS